LHAQDDTLRECPLEQSPDVLVVWLFYQLFLSVCPSGCVLKWPLCSNSSPCSIKGR
jgi:hypothetical protein